MQLVKAILRAKKFPFSACCSLGKPISQDGHHFIVKLLEFWTVLCWRGVE